MNQRAWRVRGTNAWLHGAETIHRGAVFMSLMNCVNAIFTLAGQLPTPDLVVSPQYRTLSERWHIIYLVMLLVLIGAVIRWPYRGGWWLVLGVSVLRISDNIHPAFSVVNVMMWITVSALSTAAFFTLWTNKPKSERNRAAVMSKIRQEGGNRSDVFLSPPT